MPTNLEIIDLLAKTLGIAARQVDHKLGFRLVENSIHYGVGGKQNTVYLMFYRVNLQWLPDSIVQLKALTERTTFSGEIVVSARTSWIASAMAPAERSRSNRPCRDVFKTSGTPPTAVAMTGVPHARLSKTTFGMPS